MRPAIHADALELADLLRPAWAQISDAIPAWHPRCEGENEGEGTGGEGASSGEGEEGESEGAGSEGEATGAEEGTSSGASADPPKTDWVKEARKHEREKKSALKREADLKKRLDEIDAANLSEQEKAIKQAREEARTEALTEAEKARRSDRLEVAVTRLAVARGVTLGEGDKAQTVKFADPDDVQMWLERQIEKGDIDADDLYKDGKVIESALTGALIELAESKPGWLASAPVAPNGGKPAGDPDAGKGAPPKAEGSVEDHLRVIQKK